MKYSTIQIVELFPNLVDIKDNALRDAVAAVWSEAIMTGCGGKGWTFDELRAVPFTLLAGDIELRFIEHVNSCARQCIAIAGVLKDVYGSRIPINVGKLLEFDKDAAGRVVKGFYGDMLRHPFSGVAMCYKHGIPPEVMHIVATHSHEGDKADRTIESWIFHHADFIDFDIAKVLGRNAAKGMRP